MTHFTKQLALLATAFLCSQALCAQIAVYVNGEQTLLDAPAAVNGEQTASFTLSDKQSFISQSGQPQIPFQTVKLLLPPEADLSSIELAADTNYDELQGSWNVLPQPPAAMRNEDGSELIIWPAGANITDGFDADIYQADQFWPAPEAILTSAGKMRNYKIAEVAVPLFRCNPVTGQLLKLSEAAVYVSASEPLIKTASAETPMFAVAAARVLSAWRMSGRRLRRSEGRPIGIAAILTGMARCSSKSLWRLSGDFPRSTAIRWIARR